jgi:hypothetical protein
MSKEAISLPEQHEAERVYLTPCVTFRWLEQGNAFEISLGSIQRSDVDAYINTNLQLLRDWDIQQPFFSLQDFSSENVSMTPYIRSRLQEVINLMNDRQLTGNSVVIFSPNFQGRVMEFLGRFFPGQATVKQSWIVGHERAYDTLRELMATHRTAS